MSRLFSRMSSLRFSWHWLPLLVAAAAGSWSLPQVQASSGMQPRWILASAVALAYLTFCVVVFLRYRRLQREQEQRWSGTVAITSGAAAATKEAVLVVFASQTGFAEQLAWHSAQNLRDGGLEVHVLPLGKVSDSELAAVTRVLFVVSTSGEGDVPDSAAAFARKMTAGPAPLSLATLRFGVLALGDRSYAQFCGFGHALENWLRRSHAQPLFDMVEVDNGDEGALRHWQHQLSQLSGHAVADWSRPHYARWRLEQRRLLNPGSSGAAAFHLSLTPLDLPAPVWQAGDIVEIGPCNAPADVAAFMQKLQLQDTLVKIAHVAGDGDVEQTMSVALRERHLPFDTSVCDSFRGLSAQQVLLQLEGLPHREYSIASLPQDGALDLLVRQVTRTDGTLGLGSGWLTSHATIGAEISLRIRVNRSFHAPVDDLPLILIGNGTGLAGLRAHLRARVATGRRRNWLLFGERQQAFDYFHRDEIQTWLAQGMLQRLDLAFSRDQAERVYVQDKLRAAADELRRWVADGAAIYVCGSLQGMAAGVAAVLTEVLGEEGLITLTEQGRYRRDVY